MANLTIQKPSLQTWSVPDPYLTASQMQPPSVDVARSVVTEQGFEIDSGGIPYMPQDPIKEIPPRLSPLAAYRHPLQVVKILPDSVRIVFGTIGGVVPKVGTTPLTPTLIESPVLTCPTGAATGFVYAEIDVTSSPLDIAIKSSTAMPVATDETAYLMLASYNVQDGAITALANNLTGSQALYSCGSTHLFNKL